MIGSLWSGISGVNANSKALNVGSNNVANVNTVGYRSDRASFADLMYQNGIGKGTKIEDVSKNFQQGNLKLTGNSYDFALEGRGFFMVNDIKTNSVVYTRAGNFKMGSNGNLTTVDGSLVQGTQTTPATAVSSNDNTIFTNEYDQFLASQTINNNGIVSTINTKSTDYIKSATDIGTSGNGYKNSSTVISDVEASKIDYREKLALYSKNPDVPSVASVSQETLADYTGSFADLNSKDDSISIVINGQKIRQEFDTDAQTTMNLFADKISKIQSLSASVDDLGNVTISSLIPGKDVKITDAKINDNAGNITNTVEPVLGSGQAMIDSSRDALKANVEKANASFLDLTNKVDTTANAGLTTGPVQLKLDSLGVSEQGFGTLETQNGVLYMKQGDTKFVVGNLVTATFNDEGGLKSLGDNNYAKTAQSGDAIYANEVNNIVSSSLELSNATLSTSLTDMMVYQRAFEASAKSITTSDQFLNIAIQLKK